MNIYSIYKITCIVNQKVYIGFTSQDPNTRYAEHLAESARKRDKRHFYCALRQHGSSNFVIDVLYQSYDLTHTHEVMEDYFINEYDSLRNGYNSVKGGTGHITRGRTKFVCVYNKHGTLLRTFPSVKLCAEFIDVQSCRISMACTNAKHNKGSRVKQYWVAYKGDSPGYKTPNTSAGCDAARKHNTGKKRPAHSEIMKTKIELTYHIPEGVFSLRDACDYYGRDQLMAWCNNPDKTITKSMITRSKKLTYDKHYAWIGKTCRDVGFYRV